MAYFLKDDDELSYYISYQSDHLGKLLFTAKETETESWAEEDESSESSFKTCSDHGLGKCWFPVSGDVFETDIKYWPIKPLGRGTFGVVCSALDQETKEEVAIKKVANVFDIPGKAASTLREMTILRQIQHENIIVLKTVMWPRLETEFEDVYMVMELMEINLRGYMRSRKDEGLSENEIRKFMFEILCGVNYLHSANILHRDLKPDNILIDSKGHLKICDFGLSTSTPRSFDDVMFSNVGTRLYRAPELLVGNTNYWSSIDMWSVGCIFAEMLEGRRLPIFCGTNTKDQLQRIITTIGKPEEEDMLFIGNPCVRTFIQSCPQFLATFFETRFPKAGLEALDLLKKMLTFNPTKRISAAEALRHPYMAPYYDPEATTGPEVPAQHPVEVDVDDDMDEDETRMKMLSEMRHFLKD